MPLLLSLLSLLFAAAPAYPADAYHFSVEIEASVPAEAMPASGCTITVEGRHGGASGEVTFDAGESQVRTRVGWWAALARGGDTAQLTLRPGQSFSEEYELRLGCDAHRRYRFIFTHEGTTHTHAYPSEDGFTQERVIDLGAVSRFFGIAPAAEPPPVALAGLELEGEWIRSESNNDPNDGMRIRVEGDRATITSVPESASSAWREGETIWRDVHPDGTLRVLGSNDSYYDAELTASGENQLTLSIRSGGAGNAQTWVRSGGCWSAAYMAEHGTRAPNIWVRFSTALPAGLQDALRDARDAGAAIQTVALTPSSEWVVVAANKPCYSAGFPADAREWIDRYAASGREIDVVAFGPGGRWLVVAEDYLRRASNVSDEIAQAIRRAQENDGRVTSFAFSPTPDERWALTAGGQAVTGRARVALPNTVEAALEGRRPVHEIAIGPGDEWVMIAEDWFVTNGAPASLLEQMEQYRTDARRRIDHVVLHEVEGQTRWAIISNGPEPAPDAADRINLFEQQLTGDSTVYQRMKTHRITGLAIALVENNRVAWTRSYGLRRVDFPEEYVYPSTIFDAASISKPVTYAAALQLVDDGAFGLTETGVLYDLADDELPSRGDLDAIRADEIHLAHLLSHCAGIDNQKGSSGAQEILPGDPLPSLRQMFLGQSPAASGNQVVRVDSVEVGEMYDYSGANSLLVQALIEHHASGGYDGHMERFLGDVGVERSTFHRDFHTMIPGGAFAHGHLIGDGTVLTMRMQTYPNQAAAGLRTTAGNLARYIIMLNQGGMIDGRRILDAGTVDRFIGRDGAGGIADAACDDVSGGAAMKLGINSTNLGTTNERYWHGGLHNGYRTYLSGLPQQQGGVVIFITGTLNDADALRDEIRAALRTAYGWGSL